MQSLHSEPATVRPHLHCRAKPKATNPFPCNSTPQPSDQTFLLRAPIPALSNPPRQTNGKVRAGSDLAASSLRLRPDRRIEGKVRMLKRPTPTAEIRRMKLEVAPERSARIRLSDVIRQFTPNWFTVTMGTGALALALNQIALPISGADDVASALWLFDIVLFVVFAALYAARWVFFFDGARQILRHPVASMFLGAIPMGLATIINGLLIFGLALS